MVLNMANTRCVYQQKTVVSVPKAELLDNVVLKINRDLNVAINLCYLANSERVMYDKY